MFIEFIVYLERHTKDFSGEEIEMQSNYWILLSIIAGMAFLVQSFKLHIFTILLVGYKFMIYWAAQ